MGRLRRFSFHGGQDGFSRLFGEFVQKELLQKTRFHGWRQPFRHTTTHAYMQMQNAPPPAAARSVQVWQAAMHSSKRLTARLSPVGNMTDNKNRHATSSFITIPKWRLKDPRASSSSRWHLPPPPRCSPSPPLCSPSIQQALTEPPTTSGTSSQWCWWDATSS